MPVDVHVCRVLLEYGANPDSEFDEQLSDYVQSSRDQRLKIFVREGKENALHAAYRYRSQEKIDPLIDFGANTNRKWLGETMEEIKGRYMFEKAITNFKHELCVLETVKACRKFMRAK